MIKIGTILPAFFPFHSQAAIVYGEMIFIDCFVLLGKHGGPSVEENTPHRTRQGNSNEAVYGFETSFVL